MQVQKRTEEEKLVDARLEAMLEAVSKLPLVTGEPYTTRHGVQDCHGCHEVVELIPKMCISCKLGKGPKCPEI